MFHDGTGTFLLKKQTKAGWFTFESQISSSVSLKVSVIIHYWTLCLVLMIRCFEMIELNSNSLM